MSAGPSDAAGRGLTRDSLGYVVGSVATRAAPLVLVPLVVRALATDAYGMVDLLSVFAGVLAVVLGLGLDAASARFHYDTDDERERRRLVVSAFAVQFGAAALASGILALSVPLWASVLTGRSDQVLPIRVALLGVPTTAALTSLTAALRVRALVGRFNAVCIIQGLALIGVTGAVLAAGRRDETAVLLAASGGAALALVAAGVLCARHLAASPSWRAIRSMARYGAPLIPVAVVSMALPLVARIAVAHLRGSSDVALLGLASKVAAAVGLLIGAFQLAWSPFALSIARRPDAPSVYARTLVLALVPFTIVGVLLSVFGRLLVEAVASTTYAAAAPLIPWLVVGVIASGLFQVTTIGAVVAKRSGVVAAASMASLAICCLLVVPSVAVGGAEGAAAATAVALVFSALLPLLSRRIVRIPFTLRPVAAFLLFSGAVAGVASHVSLSGRLAEGALAAAVSIAYLTVSTAWASHAGLLPAGTGARLRLLTHRPAIAAD